MKRVFFKTREATANQSGAMEPETISNNGARPSLMSRGNFFRNVCRGFLYCLVMMSIALSGCKKDGDDLSSVGPISPPEWLIGNWYTPSFEFCFVKQDDVTVGMKSLKSEADFNKKMNTNPNVSWNTIELKKTGTEYEVGIVSVSSSNTIIKKFPRFSFKKGDGTFIEAATYNDKTNKWSEFNKYKKSTTTE